MAAFYPLLGDPLSKYEIIHVAGTNGKGTFTHKTALALQAAGYRTGQFMSPHITTIRERISVDQEYIPKEFINEFVSFLKIHPKETSSITYFDFITLMAFKYWEESKIDVATLEVGLGGRLDSTNIVPNPILTVVTSIGYDHVGILGDTLEQITDQKLGIVKKGAPLLIGDTVPYQQAREKADKVGSSIYSSRDLEMEYNSIDNGKKGTNYDDENKILVKMGAQILKGRFNYSHEIDKIWDIPQACRYEFVAQELLRSYGTQCRKVILDVGHNV